jgi:uncharacterized protein YbjQ (UPF0145 family)
VIKARDLAFEEITEADQELGANAIVGVDIDSGLIDSIADSYFPNVI